LYFESSEPGPDVLVLVIEVSCCFLSNKSLISSISWILLLDEASIFLDKLLSDVDIVL
jgi:hypothetical protein